MRAIFAFFVLVTAGCRTETDETAGCGAGDCPSGQYCFHDAYDVPGTCLDIPDTCGEPLCDCVELSAGCPEGAVPECTEVEDGADLICG